MIADMLGNRNQCNRKNRKRFRTEVQIIGAEISNFKRQDKIRKGQPFGIHDGLKINQSQTKG